MNAKVNLKFRSKLREKLLTSETSDDAADDESRPASIELKTDAEGKDGAGEDETPFTTEAVRDWVGKESAEEGTSGENGNLQVLICREGRVSTMLKQNRVEQQRRHRDDQKFSGRYTMDTYDERFVVGPEDVNVTSGVIGGWVVSAKGMQPVAHSDTSTNRSRIIPAISSW